MASLSPARSTVVQPQSVVDESSDSSQNKLNCEILHDPMGFELRWIMDGDEVIMQLVGRVGQYQIIKQFMFEIISDFTWLFPNAVLLAILLCRKDVKG